jgi:serine/threonine-protein kinase HipA
MKKAENIFINNKLAGKLSLKENKYMFEYNENYLNCDNPEPLCLAMPLTKSKYESEQLFPFFEGLTQEGWLLTATATSLHIDPDDHFQLLMNSCHDSIGNVTIGEIDE